MLDLYKRAFEQIRSELDELNSMPNGYGASYCMGNIENIVLDLEEMVEKAKEIKLS